MLAVNFRPTTVTTKLGIETQTIHLVAEKEMCRDTVHEVLRQVSAEQIIIQHREGNQNPRVVVDGSDHKPVRQAERKVVILFPAAAMKVALGIVRAALRQAIMAMTQRRTGRLEDDWIFIHVMRDDNGNPIRSQTIPANADLAMGLHDFVVLRPVGDAARYAAFTNMRVAHSSHTVRGSGGQQKAARRPKMQGFMAMAVRHLRRHPISKSVSVRVVFSKRYAPAGASKVQGMPSIVLKPKRY